ncbi:hypothetical protein C7H19_17520 [Aphanothece hegewaldii CCALA 016]|uniref:Uncharacterized protein n=1 Tax=Aphanothece hegewaldii CCALA 016 TaxID=2107694 RepID=A0A2T1LUG4_9CHRO|nr:hypothetical protein [Aphanothece hegewaldii]PSF35181.1 hypothetical protein C7H19_17520 [Aphanothece hegewaldii CCALA 016]
MIQITDKAIDQCYDRLRLFGSDVDAVMDVLSLLSTEINLKDLFEDLSRTKKRYVREIKFFRYDDGQLGIAVFDPKTIYGECWIENIKVPQEYEPIFNSSDLVLGVKYPIELFGISCFPASKPVINNQIISQKLIETIFERIKE